MNRLKKGVIFAIIIMTVYNCTSTGSSPIHENTNSQDLFDIKSYQDSIFPGFEGDLSDPQTIYKRMNIYLPAHSRMMKQIYIRDKQLAWDIKKGAESIPYLKKVE